MHRRMRLRELMLTARTLPRKSVTGKGVVIYALYAMIEIKDQAGQVRLDSHAATSLAHLN
jgi:hypothetical protein